jgi:hypothetical protein
MVVAVAVGLQGMYRCQMWWAMGMARVTLPSYSDSA